MRCQFIFPLVFFASPVVYGQAIEPADSTDTEQLDEVVVQAPGGVRKLKGATNTQVISVGELRRAACCNLGESFTTNPSVDVNYSDAATGARQIKLLGLSGAYVQMLTENIPNLRGVAMPFGLGYISGPWMQSIQVSKGASSVKNGYESITGQINIEMKKPQLDPSLSVNMYYDSMNKLEFNADGNLHLGHNWSGGLLVHGENTFTAHDGNGDGFVDLPQVKQISVLNRWAHFGTNHVFQGGVKLLGEWRRGGQSEHHHSTMSSDPLYTIGIDTHRAEFFTKNAYIFDHENDGNVALIASGSYHDQGARYGLKICDISQLELYTSLMFEHKWNDGKHALSTGLNWSYDNFHYNYRFDTQSTLTADKQPEAVSGAYAQYTLNLDDKLIAMAGLRYDYNSVYGSKMTPRLHLRWNPSEVLSAHASVGKGYRSPHPLAEYGYLLASSRRLEIAPINDMESAWNYGGGLTVTTHPGDTKLSLSAEYYYTDFSRQLVADLNSDPHAALISVSDRDSYSHALQIESTFEPIKEISITAAWRYTGVKVDYGYGLVNKPLTSRHKGLLTVSYGPNMSVWQFDITGVINGGGDMPAPYTTGDGVLSWNPTYKAFPQLNAQITRNFRHWSVYVGGENLTAFKQKIPIIDAGNPWGPNFDSTMIYGPIHGALVYVGFRYNVTRYL